MLLLKITGQSDMPTFQNKEKLTYAASSLYAATSDGMVVGNSLNVLLLDNAELNLVLAVIHIFHT